MNPYQNPNDSQKNWVGRLQKLAQQNFKCFPQYEFSESTPRLFDCRVTLLDWQAIGQDTSKPKAKRMAAYLLYQQLESRSQDSELLNDES